MSKIFKQKSVIIWLKRGVISLLILIIVLPIAGALYQFAATTIDRHNFPPSGQLVEMGGHKLHLHCVGIGSPTIIMESGLGSTSLDWGLVQPALAKETRVCTYDRAGLGWSDTNPANAARTSQQIARELHQLLETAEIPAPYILVGLSAGGMHVQTYATQYAEEVEGLVLVDPTPAQFMAGLPEEKRQPLLPNLEQFKQIQIFEVLGLMRLIPLPGSDVLASLPLELQQNIRAFAVQSGVAKALYAEAAGIEQSILQTASLAPLPPDMPVTVIWHGIPVEPVALEPQVELSLRQLVEQSENGRFLIAENSGHYIPFDRPDIVIAETARMIQMAQLATR